jgi:ABC-type bacteriocin/lantibiotic exporter with double-glycine peptidase domain
MFAIGSLRIMPSINRVAVANHNIKFYGETISQLLFDTEYFDYTKEKKSKKSKNSIKNSIKFKNVNYGVLNKKIIENLNLQISFKDKILVVGKSGSGKTTFLKILAGLLPINSGIIYTGKKINKNFLRFKEPISFLSQENFIVDKKSIFYNICLKDKEDAKDRELIQFQKVVEIANLQDLLTKLRLKDDTILHENGSNISGGEKQRICLARSLFSNNQFIIMDEPFSSIDKQNSNEIFKKVLKETENKTLILSNHKKIDLKKFNKIFFFEESQLIKIKKIK